MIADYLYTIGKYLAPSQRDEVLKEIEANLYDYLEENYGPRDYTAAEIEAAIKAMGHPRRVAEAYQNGPRVLIGPAYIDTYWLVVKITLVSIAIGLTVANMLAAPQVRDGLELLLQLAGQLWQAGLAAVGMITLIFAAIHHYSPEAAQEPPEGWSVKNLEKAPAPSESVKLWDVAIETFFLVIGLVVINRVSLRVGIGVSDSVIIPMMNMATFGPFILWIQLLMGASLLLNGYLLIKRKWQTATRLISILLDALSILLFAKLAYTPEIWDISRISGALAAEKVVVAQWFHTGLQASVVVFAMIVGFEIYGQVKALWQENRK